MLTRVALMVSLVSVLAAAPLQKQPGGAVHRNYAKALAMTDLERATARQAAMSRGDMPRSPHVSAARSTSTNFSDVVDGRRNPEMFFRYELFDELVMVFCPENEYREAAKQGWSPDLRGLGIDDALFWEQLEQSVGSYRSEHCIPRGRTVGGHTVSVRIKTMRGEGDVKVHVDLQKCRGRAAAFDAAQKAIGKVTLAKVLYGVVAPVSKLSYATGDEHHIDEMLYIEGGCK